MKKTTRVIAVAGTLAISWVTGAIVYFMSVSSYFRKKEKREEEQKNISDYLSSVARTGSVKPADKEALGITKSSPRVIRDRNPDWHSGITTVPNKWRSYYDPDAKPNYYNDDK
jgi:hypothetical protein